MSSLHLFLSCSPLTANIQNMHELACVSGMAAAYRLGADYEKFDDFAEEFFSNVLLITHGARYKGQHQTDKRTKQMQAQQKKQKVL